MKTHFKTLLKIILVLSTLSGCAGPEPIHDHVIYGDEGIHGAVAVHTLFTDIKPLEISPDAWPGLRLGMACMTVNDLSMIQQSVDDLCTKNTGACTYDVEQAVAAAKEAIRQLKAHFATSFPAPSN